MVNDGERRNARGARVLLVQVLVPMVHSDRRTCQVRLLAVLVEKRYNSKKRPDRKTNCFVSYRKKGHLDLSDVWRASPSMQSDVLMAQFHEEINRRYGGRLPETWLELCIAAIRAVCYKDLWLSFLLATVYLFAQLGKQ